MVAAITLMYRVGLHWLQQAGRRYATSAQFRANHHNLSLKSKDFAVASSLRIAPTICTRTTLQHTLEGHYLMHRSSLFVAKQIAATSL